MTVCGLLLFFVSCWGKNVKLLLCLSILLTTSLQCAHGRVIQWPHADNVTSPLNGVNTNWRWAATNSPVADLPYGCFVAAVQYTRTVDGHIAWLTNGRPWVCWNDPSEVDGILANLHLPTSFVTGSEYKSDVCLGVAFSPDGLNRLFPAGCSGAPPSGVSCTVTDGVIDHGHVAPGAQSTVTSTLSVACNSATTARLELVADRIELGKGVVSVVGIEQGSFTVDPSRLRKVTSTLSVAPGASPGVFSGAALVLLSYE